MSLVLVTAAEPLVSLAEAKAHLNVDHSDDDTLIGIHVAAATAMAEQWTGRAFAPQVWDQFDSGFPWHCDPAIKLALRPIISVDQITYVDQDGEGQTWAPANYSLYGAGSGYGSSILPVPSASYPATQYRPEAVRIRFTAGYNNLAHQDINLARAAILIMTADIYAFRESAAVGTIASEIKMSATPELLLGGLRVWA
jgi:uncharacterized phiE125 gp8 family phage protein